VTPAQQFEAWCVDWLAEREVKQQQLADARTKLAAAEIAYDAAKTVQSALNEFARGALPNSQSSMATILHARLVNSREDLTAAEGIRGGLRALVKQLENRVADLSDAIAQANRAIDADKVTEQLRPIATPTRRLPQPISFDNIEMPREA
jgi:hypothetical protein